MRGLIELPPLHPSGIVIEDVRQSLVVNEPNPGAGKMETLLAEVIAVAGAHVHVFLFGDGEMDFVVADGVAFVGGVGEAVLVAEVFVDFGVDFVERFLFWRL